MTTFFKMTRSRVIALATMIALLAWATGMPAWIHTAGAAVATDFSDLITDSDVSVSANHTVSFTLAQAVADDDSTIVIDFDGFAVGSVTDHADMDISGSTTGEMTTADNCLGTEEVSAFFAGGPSNITVTLQFCNGDGGNLANGETVTVEIGDHAAASGTGSGQFTNPSTTGSKSISLSGTAGVTGETFVAIVDDVTVTASVGAAFTFTVAGVASGTDNNNGDTDCNGDANTDITTTATTIPFGTLSANTPLCGAQDLTVTSNATGGHNVTVWQSGDLENSSADTINVFADGTDGAPQAWAAPSGTTGSPDTYGHWGVTSSDGDIDQNSGTTTDTFASALYDAVGTEAAPIAVFAHDSVGDGTTAGTGSARVNYKIEIDSLQEFGDYTTTLTYIATPTF